MYQLNAIGKIQRDKMNMVIVLKKDYRKALKYLDEFSHIHIFYAHQEKGIWNLQTRIAKIQRVDREKGIICIDEIGEEIDEVDVIDIKPYFPCEDSVKAASKSNVACASSIEIIKADCENSYQIEQKGMIRNTHGKVYIQLEDMVTITSQYIKVLWWFHKFDADKYRKATECNPPYENAPRTGIFATRSPVRPNPLAVTVARIIKVEKEQKRIYINEIESFDKTPCIGIMEYDQDKDCILECEVPKWLSHWPKWYEDKETDSSECEIFCKDSGLIVLLNESRKSNKEGNKESNEESSRESNKESNKESSRKSNRESNKESSRKNNGESNIESNIESSKKSNRESNVENNRENIETAIETSKAEKKDAIWIRGARENNLKGINVSIPYGKITAVVGVSGSGKSSLVNDTIYAECRRRMEYLNHNHNRLQKPNVENMTGCIPAVMISQSSIRGNSQSTVGTYTNAYDYLRIIYASVAIRHCPECGNEIVPLTKTSILNLLNGKEEAQIVDLMKQTIEESSLEKKIDSALERGKGAFYIKLPHKDYILLQTKQKCYRCDKLMFEMTPQTFSFLDSESRCPICNGTGKTAKIDEQKVIEHPERSLLDGASSFYGKLRGFLVSPNANWMKGQVAGLAHKMGEDLEKPWNELSHEFRDKLLHGSGDKTVTFVYDNKKTGRRGEITRPVEGICQIISRIDDEDTRALDKYKSKTTCNSCKGERLNKEGRIATIGQIRYPQAAAMTFDEVIAFCNHLRATLSINDYEKVKTSIDSLNEVAGSARRLGIGYLQLSQETSTLSGGEGQRIKLLAALFNHMTGILYLFDEPSKGLHPKDYAKVADMIQYLKNEGNTIMMVEHNEDMLKIADHMIEIGPGAGRQGGLLVGEGSLEAMIKHRGTQISHYLSPEAIRKVPYIKKNQDKLSFITMAQLNHRNLKNISIKFPKKALTCISGVSGSGKSSLMKNEIYVRAKEGRDFSEVVLVDQLPIGKTSKSVVATYIGVMDCIRQAMSLTNQAVKYGFDEKYFSFNVEAGQCATCKGEGSVKLKYLEDSYVQCPDCKGKRYQKKILEIEYHEKNIDDILNMSIDQGLVFWRDVDEIVKKLEVVKKVGMGYLKMGQGTPSLSGGEASRLKLAKELMGTRRKNVLYLLDEPTTGLHFSDVDHLLALISELVESGNTVIAIEHNKQFVQNSDWIIELGPGAGKNGGEVVRQGIL